MANLDAEKLKEKLAQIVVNVLEAQEKSVVTGILNLQGDIIERVFTNGQDVDGNQIGNYSTKPIYVSIPETIKKYGSQINTGGLKPRGKERGSRAAAKTNKIRKGKTKKFKTDDGDFSHTEKRERTSMYMPGGYLEFRNVVKRPTDKVNLFLTGSLQGSILPGTTNGNPSLSIATDFELEKADANEKRFGKIIFSPSEAELNRITDKWADDTTEAFFDSFEP